MNQQIMNQEPSTPLPREPGAGPKPAAEEAAAAAAAKNTPLQVEEKPDESLLESLGKAISAPVRDAAEDEERKQTGQTRGG